MVSVLERRVNYARGHATLYITALSIALVLVDPACLIFWAGGAYDRIVAPTGRVGVACSAAFLAYLLIDTAVALSCRQHFRRSMGSLYLHHALVGVGVAAFLLPSPPRGFFFYVWGEALTACRLLPPWSRFRARSGVFAFRRALWLYLICRDAWFFSMLCQRYGLLYAVLPISVAFLLLGLDCMWWREHVRSGQSTHGCRAAHDEASADAPLCTSSPQPGTGSRGDGSAKPILLVDGALDNGTATPDERLQTLDLEAATDVSDEQQRALVPWSKGHRSSLEDSLRAWHSAV
mmetsp:Transcript_3039/g.6894  ORF Transcript_3039/g.6894 Transcript_3039/m.6894 type:complete len:291 (+) Transcript_3039:47-919(+)